MVSHRISVWQSAAASLHPLAADFAKNILHCRDAEEGCQPAEALRKRLLADDSMLPRSNLGAGFRRRAGSIKVSELARHSSVKPRKGRLLYRMARHYAPSHIIEFGTCLGISTIYMACGCPLARLHTVEGHEAAATLAGKNFMATGFPDIRLHCCTFAEAFTRLPGDGISELMVFIDGDHRLHPTVDYVSQFMDMQARTLILVLDDINWSPPMKKAWRMIRDLPGTGITVDLYDMGIVFRCPTDEKQNFSFIY